MMSYRDRAYCYTGMNKCINKECDRHPETEDERFTLKNNKKNYPVSYTDFSEDCTEYKQETS